MSFPGYLTAFVFICYAKTLLTIKHVLFYNVLSQDFPPLIQIRNLLLKLGGTIVTNAPKLLNFDLMKRTELESWFEENLRSLTDYQLRILCKQVEETSQKTTVFKEMISLGIKMGE